jgi:hypothetical protein
MGALKKTPDAAGGHISCLVSLISTDRMLVILGSQISERIRIDS